LIYYLIKKSNTSNNNSIYFIWDSHQMKNPAFLWTGFLLLCFKLSYTSLINDIASPWGVGLPCGYCFPVYVDIILIVLIFCVVLYKYVIVMQRYEENLKLSSFFIFFLIILFCIAK